VGVEGVVLGLKCFRELRCGRLSWYEIPLCSICKHTRRLLRLGPNILQAGRIRAPLDAYREACITNLKQKYIPSDAFLAC
jgi:hypothetical protein